MTSNASKEFVVLDTGLFNDQQTLVSAIDEIDIPPGQKRKLDPATMNDSDWDEILDLVLCSRCVITI